jgi:hypothetical protein
MTEPRGPDSADPVGGADVAATLEAMARTAQDGIPLEEHAGHLAAAQAALAALLEAPSQAGPTA